jgi:hypothetical protein
MARRPKHQGRVTPKARPADSTRRQAREPKPLGQVGRRPSSPGFLMVLGLMWIGSGVVALTSLTASWKIVPGVVFIGIGLFFIRGAATSVVRREERQE